MRILMLAQFYPPILGGEERHVRNLALSLAARGHTVAVATLSDRASTSETTDGPVKIYRVHGLMQRAAFLYTDGDRRHATPFPDPELSMRLMRIVRKFKPDIVHAHNWIVHSYLPVKPFWPAPLLLTLHDFSMVCSKKTLMRGDTLCDGPRLTKCMSCAGEHYGAAKGSVTMLGNRASSVIERGMVDHIISVSRAVALGNKLTDDLAHQVIPNFIPDEFPLEDGHEERLSRLPADPFILFVGDLRRLKGLHAVIEGYTQLRDPPALVCIGRPCPDTPTSLPKGVTILTNWPHGAIMQAWRRSYFGVVPSIWSDPCPTVTLEAMASSKAVIGTITGGIPDMIDDGNTGYLVPPRDAKALADAMQKLIDEPALAAAMGVRGAAKAQGFMASSVVPQVEALYRQLVDERRVAAVAGQKVG